MIEILCGYTVIRSQKLTQTRVHIINILYMKGASNLGRPESLLGISNSCQSDVLERVGPFTEDSKQAYG